MQVPDHLNAAPNPAFVGFGDPGNAIGRVVSICSNFPAMMPQPYVNDQSGSRILVAFAAAAGAALIFQMINRQIVIAIFDAKASKTFAPFFPLLQLGVFVGALGVLIGVYLLSTAIFKKKAAGPEFLCSMVGEEGALLFRRGPERDTATLIRFEGLTVRSQDLTETTIYKDQYGNRRGQSIVHTVLSEWRNPEGNLVYRFYWKGEKGRGPQDEMRFVDGAENAQARYRVRQAASKLDNEGIRFPVQGTPNYIHVFVSRVDVALGGPPFSVTPAQISAAHIHDGQLTIHFPHGPITVSASLVAEARLLLAILRSLGVSVAA